MRDLQLIILLGLAVYRVVRFIQLDTLIAVPRIWLQTTMLQHRMGMVAHLLFECPYCLSVWVSAVAVAVANRYTDVTLPGIAIAAVSAASLAVWRYIEG